MEIVTADGVAVVIDATVSDHGESEPRSVTIRREAGAVLDLPRDCGDRVPIRWLESALILFSTANNAVLAGADAVTVMDDDRPVSLDAGDLLRYVRARNRPGRPGPKEWRVKEALRLRGEGLTLQAIAECLSEQTGAMARSCRSRPFRDG